MSTKLNYIVFRFRNTKSDALTCFITISHDHIVAAVESIGRKHPSKEIIKNLITSSKISDSITSFILLTTMFFNPEYPSQWFCDAPENIVRHKKEWILKNKREELELIYYREV